MIERTPKQSQLHDLIEGLVDEINSDLGFKRKGAARSYATLEDSEVGNISGWISTGVKSIDRIVGCRSDRGCIPIGRSVEIAGDPSAGKTLLLTNIVKDVQKDGGIAIMADTERAYVQEFMVQVGIDPKGAIVSDPDTIEQCGREFLKIMDIIRGKTPDRLIVFIVDSLADLSTEHEIADTGFETRDMFKPLLMKRFFRQLIRPIQRNNCLLIMANHFIQGPETPKGATTGGSGSKYGSSLRLEMYNRRPITPEGKINPVGCQTLVHVAKSRVGPSYRQALIDVYFGTDGYQVGIDPLSGLLEVLINEGKIQHDKGSAWYGLGDKKFMAKNFNQFYLDNQKELDQPVTVGESLSAKNS